MHRLLHLQEKAKPAFIFTDVESYGRKTDSYHVISGEEICFDS